MRNLILSTLLLLACLSIADSQNQAKITNVFTDTDVKTVLSEVASAGGATIIPDSSVKDLEISVELKDESVESALDKIALFGDLVWKNKNGIYLVSTGQPDAPLFMEFAVTKLYSPRTQAAESLFALLARRYQTYVSLDKNANVLAITGPDKSVQKVLDVLDRIDCPRKQYVVEAMITEVKEEKGKEYGFSWNWRNFSSGGTGLQYSRASSTDIIKLKSLVETGKAKMRANPRVVAESGQEAMIMVGNETYFPMTSGNTTYPTVTLTKIATGITLKFTGYVDDDGTINLRLQPEVGDAVAQVNGAPTTTIRRADTHIRVKNGETFVLGGLIVDSTATKKSKIPILGDAPLIGGLFRSSSNTEMRNEVVIFITSHLVTVKTEKDAKDKASSDQL